MNRAKLIQLQSMLRANTANSIYEAIDGILKHLIEQAEKPEPEPLEFTGEATSESRYNLKEDRMTELQEAAKAVCDRWDSPDWADGTHTLDYINRLRKAIAKEQNAEPVAWMFKCDLERFETEETYATANSVQCGYPICGKQIPLYTMEKDNE